MRVMRKPDCPLKAAAPRGAAGEGAEWRRDGTETPVWETPVWERPEGRRPSPLRSRRAWDPGAPQVPGCWEWPGEG